MAYPIASSPISPVNLPLPYDISAAVHQALKLDLAPEIPKIDAQTVEQEPLEMHDSLSSGDIEELMPNVIDSSDFIDEVWDHVTLPDDTEGAWGENTSANIDELERFCRYIDGDNDTEEDFENSYSSPEKRNKDRSSKFPCGVVANHGASGSALQYLQVELVNSELWEEFNQIGTEMVITKNGRYTLIHIYDLLAS